MKRILVFLITALLLLSLTGVVCLAADEVATEENAATYEITTDEKGDTGDGVVTEQPFFDQLYDKLVEHLGEILSALAFLGSLIIGYAYKRGLLPSLKSSITGIGAVVSAIREETEKGITENSAMTEYIAGHLADAEAVIEKLATSVAALEKKLATASEIENTRVIMQAQVDMLYEIFMTSSLPQYAKDAVGEKIAEMKARLADAANKEE